MRSCHGGCILAGLTQHYWLPLEYQGRRYKKDIQKNIRTKKELEDSNFATIYPYIENSKLLFSHVLKSKQSKTICHDSDTKYFRGLRHLENEVALTSLCRDDSDIASSPKAIILFPINISIFESESSTNKIAVIL